MSLLKIMVTIATIPMAIIRGKTLIPLRQPTP